MFLNPIGNGTIKYSDTEVDIAYDFLINLLVVIIQIGEQKERRKMSTF